MRSCPEEEPPLKPPFPAHGDDGSWRSQGRSPSGGQAWFGQLYVDWDYLRCPPVKGPEASRLSTELPETSAKSLPPGFPEAEILACRDTSGEHPSG